MKNPVLNENAVLVRHARTSGPGLVFFLGLCLLAVAICFAFIPPAPLKSLVYPGAVLGIVFFLASALWWKIELNRRVWVEVMPTGFCLLDRTGQRTVDDQQILCMSLRHERNFSSGLLQSVTRIFTVWFATTENEREQCTMTYKVPINAADPLADLIGRVNNRLLEEARKELQSGLPVLGEGWSLDRSQLIVTGTRQEPIDIPLTDLIFTAVVDKDVCMWVRGRDEAVAKVSLDKANAYLLLQLLGEQLRNRPKEESEPEEGRLGRIIFERRSSNATATTLTVLSILLGMPSLVLIFFGRTELALLMIGLACLMGSVALALGAYHSRIAFFRCHEWGVHQYGLFTDKQLRYRDVVSFTYNAVRLFVNGVYSGTTFTFVFEPIPEQKANKISYCLQLPGVDEELDNLRDQISRILAARMIQQFHKGEAVRWTKNLCYLREGLEYRPAGWIGRKEPQVLPYDQVAGYNLNQGTFSLWAKGIEKPILQESFDVPNFFPGFMMLVLMTTQEEKTTEAEE